MHIGFDQVMDGDLRTADAPALPPPRDRVTSDILLAEPLFQGLTDYRPFIDGLRAISILAVVLYHVGVPGVSGGYVGVDVFFVISGFLIISQIFGALERGSFSFGEFWARRVLRILPPYLLVLAFCMAVAPLVLVMPDEFQQFAKEVNRAAAMVINHLFLMQQGYFDTAADTKILLHLWSLAVEEQFYLVAPGLAVGMWWLSGLRHSERRSQFLATAAAVIFAVSLAGCILLTGAAGGRNYAFYLTALRAWEFVAGGSVAYLLPIACRLPIRIKALIGTAGLAAIMFAVFAYTTETPYPSWRATVPVFGAVAVILGGFAYPKSPAIRLLASPVMVWLGLVSYSWYLWHWPLLAMSRILQFGERNFVTDFALGLVSLGLAAATFYLVERPIRRWRRKRTAPLGWRPVFLAIAVCAAVSVGGLRTFKAEGKRMEETANSQYMPVAGVSAPFCDLENKTAHDCLAEAHGRPIGVVIGDSHAGAARNRLAGLAEKNETLLASFASPACMTFSGMKVLLPNSVGIPCTNLEKRTPALQEIKPAYALLYARWPIYGTPKYFANQLGPVGADGPAMDQDAAFISGLRKTIADLQSFGVERILVVGSTPLFPRSVPGCLFLADRYGRNPAKACGMDRAAAEEETKVAASRIRTAIADVPGLRYIDAFEDFCDDQHCLPFADKAVYFIDSNHLSDAGMDRVIAAHRADFDWLVAGNP